MDFSIPDRLRTLLPDVRAFLDEEIVPLERDLHAGFFAVEPRLDALRQTVKARGWWLPQIAQSAGGLGLSVLEHGLLSEVLGRSPFGHYVFGCQAPDAGNLEILLEYGTEEQRARFLAPLSAGTMRSCFAMTEPDRPGSNPTELGTIAKRDGGDWVIDGRKWFCTGADGAAFAIVMAVSAPEAAAHRRATMFIVPTDAPGFTRVRNIPVMGDVGQGWMSHAELRLEGVRVPDAQRLGGDGMGFAIAQARLGPGRIHHCMRWIGLCRRSLDAMVERAATRQIRPDRRLGDEPVVGAWIAESAAKIEAARLLVLQTADTIDRHGVEAAREAISLIKFYTADVLMEVVDRAIQVHGAAGISDDHLISWIYRHERGARIYDGPDEIHKAVVAKRILARARESRT